MNDRTTPQVVRSFLSQLEAALNGVPSEVAGEIIGGIREELDGLDVADAAARIEELGDPMFIAAEARVGLRVDEPGLPRRSGATSSMPAHAVVTVLLLILGGVVVPVLGWVAGVVLLWSSPVWTTNEKWSGTLAGPLAGLLGTALFTGLLGMINSATSAGVSNSFSQPSVLVFLVLTFLGNVWAGSRLLRSARARSHE